MKVAAGRKLVPIGHRPAFATQGSFADYCGYLGCVASELLFLGKFWIYWLHIATALVVYPMFAR